MPGPWEKYQAQKPLSIQGPPREPSPQTPAQSTIDTNRAVASTYDPAKAAAEAENTRLRNQQLQDTIDNRLDPKATDFLARQWIMTGQMPQLGMGGGSNRTKILNRAAEMAGAKDLSPEAAQVAFARYRNRVGALQQQEKTVMGLHGNEEAALANVQQYVDQSAQLPLQTGSPLVNGVTQFMQRHVWSDPTLARMDTAMANAGGEIGKVISGTPSGGGVLSDSQRQEAMRMLQGTAPIETKRAILEQLRIDMDNRIKGQLDTINQGYSQVENGGQPTVPGQGPNDRPPMIGGPHAPNGPQGPGGPGGGPPGPGRPGGPGGGPETWRDGAATPGVNLASGGTRDVFDGAISARGEQMIRGGATADDLNKFIVPQGFHPVSQADVSAAQAYLQKHPHYQGFFQATRTVPLTGVKKVMNDFVNSGPGAAAGAYMNDVTGSHLDNIANATGGDGKLVNFGLEQTAANHPGWTIAGHVGAGASLYKAGTKIGAKVAGAAGEGVAAAVAKAPAWLRAAGADAAMGGYLGSGANGEQVFDPASAAEGAGVAAATSGVVRTGLGLGARAASPTGGDMNLLYKQGVQPTLGQRVGGGYSRFEQANASLPFLGSFIRNNRNAAIDQAQRGAFNTALADIGEKLPPGTVKGTQAHAYMQQAFDKAYSNVRAGMQFAPDQQYMEDLKGFMGKLNNAELTDAEARQVAKRIDTVVGSRLKASPGALTGQAYSNTANDLAQTARKWAANPNQSGMADTLREYIDIMDEAATRSSPPEAVAALNAARTGYAKAVVIEKAANMNTGGEFTGKQLDIAAKNNSASVRNRSYLRGDAPMQDYASQMALLGNTVGDSGTLERLAATGGAGLGLGHPMVLLPSLGAVATNAPVGRNVVNALLSPRRANVPLVAGSRVTAADLRKYIDDRRAKVGGLFGAAAAGAVSDPR